MIIRTTFKDNDFTYILERYWSNFWFCNYYKSIRKLKNGNEYENKSEEADNLLSKALFKESEMTLKDIRLFINIIKDSILAYIEEFYEEDYDYLKKKLIVSAKTILKDKNENEEVVYYLLKNKKVITM